MIPKHHLHSIYHRAFYAFLVLSIIMSIGTIGLHCIEKMGYLDAFYFMSMVATAQGPTSAPVTALGKIFVAFMAFIAVGAGAASIGFLFGPFFGKLWHIGIARLEENHNESIIDQFTRQAVPFTQKIAAHSSEEAFQTMFSLSQVNSSDTVLDVACGSGLVSCAFASKAKHVTGIDITPAMIEQAQKIQHQKNLENITWQIGDVSKLPYPSESFSLVVTRFSFHHFIHPEEVLKEMMRVCAKGGRVMVVDVCLPEDKVAAFNLYEKLRDPSHVRALTEKEMFSLVHLAGLKDVKTAFYKLEVGLEEQLKASFPNPGDEEKIRLLFKQDIGKDRLGVEAYVKDSQIYMKYPVMILVGHKTL